MTYEINNKPVDKKEFDDFLATLKGSYHWTCSETTDGGVVTYQAKDDRGQMYDIFMESGGEDRNRITKINN